MEAGGTAGTQRRHSLAHCPQPPPSLSMRSGCLGLSGISPKPAWEVGSPAEKPVLEQRCLYRKDKLRLGPPA